MFKFRRNVAIILIRPDDGHILVCERTGYPNSWQFPQGGAKKSESDIQALHREVQEEISLRPHHYKILKSHGPYRYMFRAGFQKDGFDGQEQTYFLAEILPDAARAIRVDKKEFQACQWILPQDYHIEWVPQIKRETYCAVFRDFFQIHLK